MASLTRAPRITITSPPAPAAAPAPAKADDGLLSVNPETARAAARRRLTARSATVLTGWRGLLTPRRTPGRRGVLLGE